MVKEWIKPYQAWLKLYEATDGGECEVLYQWDYVVNYQPDDGFQQRLSFQGAELKSPEFEKLVRSNFGAKAWTQLSEALATLGTEPMPFANDPAGLMGYKKAGGEVVMEPQFNYAWDFQDGLAMVSVVTDSDRRGMVDVKGRIVIPPVYRTLGPVKQERILFQREHGGLYGYMDREGKVAITARFAEADDFMDDGRARVTDKAGKDHLINTKGRYVKE